MAEGDSSEIRMIVCTTCGQYKRRWRHRRLCYDCRAAWRKEYRKRPGVAEQIRAYGKEWRDKNRPAIPIEEELKKQLRRLRNSIKRLIRHLIRWIGRIVHKVEHNDVLTNIARRMIKRLKQPDRSTGWNKWARVKRQLVCHNKTVVAGRKFKKRVQRLSRIRPWGSAIGLMIGSLRKQQREALINQWDKWCIDRTRRLSVRIRRKGNINDNHSTSETDARTPAIQMCFDWAGIDARHGDA